MMEYTNNLELRVLGQMRSGNHAIIDWIRGLYPNRKVVFLNNVAHGNFDPYTNCDSIRTFNIDETLDVESVRRIKGKILIYSYEDSRSLEENNIDFISSVFDKEFEGKRQDYLGESENSFNIFILRDPFNCFASRLMLLRRSPSGKGGLANLDLIAENWKVVARKALLIDNLESGSDILVKYNTWIDDEAYKITLSERLKGDYWSKPINDIASYGGGSSFQETNDASSKLTMAKLARNWYKAFSVRRLWNFRSYLGRISPKEVTSHDFLERWKKFEDDSDYKEMFRDPDIFDLSEALFGKMPDTRRLLKSDSIE